ncbi:hypothetical protein H5410_036715 [Solanum commersonii]|uniref:Transposase-associated domain-containing protein n=1 Tax=Solanum commersonii TaxID=4109 RepID=A0A9J5Y4B1_SOLCO|nr:hypothetical protein H5410_036715 [Solanum commersonii]
MDHRLWMYNMHYETGAGLKPEFINGVRDFIEHTMTLDIFRNNGLVRCPCIMVHLYRNGFKPRYFIWVDHGERDGLNGMFYNTMHVDEYNMIAPHGQIRVEHDRVHEMINDALGVQEARCFYDQLEESSHPLSEGSSHSTLSIVVILREKLVIFILITLVIMCHVGETCPIAMMKAILILYFHRYQFLIKMVEDLKSVESEASLI